MNINQSPTHRKAWVWGSWWRPRWRWFPSAPSCPKPPSCSGPAMGGIRATVINHDNMIIAVIIIVIVVIVPITIMRVIMMATEAWTVVIPFSTVHLPPSVPLNPILNNNTDCNWTNCTGRLSIISSSSKSSLRHVELSRHPILSNSIASSSAAMHCIRRYRCHNYRSNRRRNYRHNYRSNRRCNYHRNYREIVIIITTHPSVHHPVDDVADSLGDLTRLKVMSVLRRIK